MSANNTSAGDEDTKTAIVRGVVGGVVGGLALIAGAAGIVLWIRSNKSQVCGTTLDGYSRISLAFSKL